MTSPSLQRIGDALRAVDRELFQVVAAGEPPVGAVDEVEVMAGFPLPTDYREFLLSTLSGLYVLAREEAWPSPEILSVGPAWRAQWGVIAFDITGRAEERLRLSSHLDEARGAGITDFLPILKREGDGTVYGFEPGGLIVCYIEGERYVDGSGDFADLIVREVAELQERQRTLASLLAETPSLRDRWFRAAHGDDR